MNPVCCNSEMRCQKTGVRVASSSNPTWVRSGDRFECSKCGGTVIVNFGQAFESYAEVLIDE
jgi:transposase-like protein